MNAPRALLLAVLLFVPVGAHAEGGEIYLEPAASAQIVQLGYARSSSAPEATGAWDWMPRFSIMARYGISDDWRLGLGLAYGWNDQVTYDDVTIDGFTGRLFASVHSWTTPVSLSYNLTRGYDWSGLFSVYGGPALFRWSELGLGDTSQPSPGGGLPRFDVNLKEPSHWGLTIGASADVELRPFDWLAFRLGPYVEHFRFSGSAATSFGLTLQPLAIFGIGPSL